MKRQIGQKSYLTSVERYVYFMKDTHKMSQFCYNAHLNASQCLVIIIYIKMYTREKIGFT